MEVLEHFKGKLIASFGGGCKKLFVSEEQSDEQVLVFIEGVVSCLHAEEFDDFDLTFTSGTPNPPMSTFSSKGHIKSLICGKRTMFMLNSKGELYSYGIGEYGSLGQGGTHYLQSPQRIATLSTRIVT